MTQPRKPTYPSLAGPPNTSLSVKTLRRRIADGTITGYRCGRAIRIRLDDLEAAFRKIPSAHS